MFDKRVFKLIKNKNLLLLVLIGGINSGVNDGERLGKYMKILKKGVSLSLKMILLCIVNNDIT